MSERLGPGAHTRVRRLALRVVDDVVDGVATALATLGQRVGRTIYGPAGKSHALARMMLGASVSATLYDDLRLARSGFESCVAYRSVVGAVREVVDVEERRRVLDGLVDAGLPRRATDEREVTGTLLVGVSMYGAPAQVSAGGTDEDPRDAMLATWIGTVRARVGYDASMPHTDGTMARGDIALPDSPRPLAGVA